MGIYQQPQKEDSMQHDAESTRQDILYMVERLPPERMEEAKRYIAMIYCRK